MNKYLISFWLIIACLFQARAQHSNNPIKGTVTEAGTNTPISGCNIVVDTGAKRIGAKTDKQGNYEIIMPEGIIGDSISMRFSHINYHLKHIAAASGQAMHIQLERKVHLIDNVTIHSAYSDNNKGNKFVYTPLQASSSISIIGEPDVVRYISSLPGVSQGIEGTLGLFVRGSNNGSNRIEFNGVPFYSYSHLLGLFSAFSPDIIEKTTFRPGGIPAQSGNLSSSLLQITPKREWGTPFNAKVSLSPYMTGAYLSMPLKNDKLSLQVAGRTSFMPWLINRAIDIQENNSEDEPEVMNGQVLDFTAIMDWKLNESNWVDVMFYTSNDYFDFKDSYSQNLMNWSSLSFKMGWDSHLSSKSKLETSAYYSSTHTVQEQNHFNLDNPGQSDSRLRLGSQLDEWSVNSQLLHKINTLMTVNIGFNYQLQAFEPGSEKTIYTQSVNDRFNKRQSSNLLAGFVDVGYNNPETLELSLGYRHTFQSIEGHERNNFDIRFLGDIYLSKNLGIEMSYDRMTQFYHILEGLPTGWSLNIMIPSSDAFPEEITNQLYTGLFVKTGLRQTQLHFTLGGYYRHMENLVSYINTVNMFGVKDASWEDEIDVGKGQSYGLELAGSLQGERIGTTLAYTLSKTDREFSQINNGDSYPFKFDRRHILNLQSKYTVVKNTNRKGYQREQVINGVLAFSTGHNTTLPVATYQGVMPPHWNIRETSWRFPHQVDDNAYHRQEMTARNDFKMKDYFRIDLAYTFIKHRPKSTRELSISIFNVLNRQNPYLFFYEDNKWQQLSIAPIMPSVRWVKSF
ncbi:MAG: TonB-dependent receptor [Bacteroidales bacterium]|nr:TonB-dependent receptor [Bacteroidales bacterium]